MTKSTIKPTTPFWIISVLALLWNLMGVYIYLEQAYITEEALSLLSEPEQLYYQNVASWATAAFATAVFGGFLGCVTLFLRRKIATTLFVLSLLGVLLQATYNFFIQEYMEIPLVNMILPFMIITVAIFLVWYAKDATKKGWLYK